MLLKFRNVEFNAKTITYGRNNKPAEADFLGIDSDSQDSKLDNMDFHVEGYIYGKKVEETRIKLEKALERRQAKRNQSGRTCDHTDRIEGYRENGWQWI